MKCFLILIVLVFVCSCTGKEPESEETIAKAYCGSCHLFPSPSLLTKDLWKNNVLPEMAKNLGLAYYNNEYYINFSPTEKGNNSQPAAITLKDWKKIINYYTNLAPKQMPPQTRQSINQFTGRFVVKEGIIKGSDPATTYLKIDQGNQRIYACNAYDSLFTVFDKNLHLLQQQNIRKTVVDMYFENDLRLPGDRNGALTNIGVLYPNDYKTGTVETFYLQQGKFSFTSTISDTIPRPVQTTIADLNGDGNKDYLVCGFGNQKGSFYYLQSEGDNHYNERIIRPLPGATKAYIDDYNKDGLPDIVALFAQGKEGIFLFLNKGNGSFETKELLRFPPVYGSSYFEMEDVNGDGMKDIIYTCGDNLDYTKVLKNYHGVYIFINKGADKFEQRYFFPINGCYKATARDFDKDGDLDIAAISYFPDVHRQSVEGFVYLENKGAFNFAPYSIKQVNRGNWLTMDVNDVDGDGDDDIVIGSMTLENTSGLKSIIPEKGEKPAFLLLINSTNK